MKNILHILLVLCFSLTIISCSGEKDESTTAGSGTGDTTTTNDDTTTTDNTTTDTTAPVLAEVTAITTTESATPGYTFSTTESGTITYGGACSSNTTSVTHYDFMGESSDVDISFNALTGRRI